VRLDAPSVGGRITGTLLAREADRLIVSVDGDAPGLGFIVPADSVTWIDVQRERRLTLEGAALGLLGGTLLAVGASPDCVDEYGESTALACLAYQVSPNLDTRVAVLGGVGALVGVIIGSETRSRKWVPVQLEQLGVGPAPGGGLALGVRLSF